MSTMRLEHHDRRADPASLRPSGCRFLSRLLLVILAFSSIACGREPPTGHSGRDAVASATFRVTFDATWSENSHPASFPTGPHFSGLIGGTHRDDFVLWGVGDLASVGIKDMAELGAKTALRGEVDAAIRAGEAWSLISGGGINPSPGGVGLTFEADPAFPRVSLVAMIAPSPDWFVGVAGLRLMEDGRWKDTISVVLFPHDAGTDSGTTYSAPNAVTLPPTPIRPLLEAPLDNGVPLGTFTFVRR